jgi:hypothetical protein
MIQFRKCYCAGEFCGTVVVVFFFLYCCETEGGDSSLQPYVARLNYGFVAKRGFEQVCVSDGSLNFTFHLTLPARSLVVDVHNNVSDGAY